MFLLVLNLTLDVLFRAFLYCLFFFFKQKTAYEMRISDWSSDVCSSDLHGADRREFVKIPPRRERPIPLAAHYQHRHIPVARRIEHRAERLELGRASCRERVCQYV